MDLPKRDIEGRLPLGSWLGSRSSYYHAADGGVLCPGPECANGPESRDADPNCRDDNQWCIVAADVNWEDETLTCDHCGKRIRAAYEG